jgi:hypothetical protein
VLNPDTPFPARIGDATLSADIVPCRVRRTPMAESPTSADEMRYDLLAQEALRGVIRAALKRAADPRGLPGQHHFYITFKTRAAGVSVPDDLAAKYPDEVTIVLQHQYWDLKPDEGQFSVMLKFGGVPKKLVAPYAAVTRFYDPSVQFLLQFDPPPTAAPLPSPAPEPEAPPEDEGPKVVSLDQFRKK